jgi:hypothetical protein
MKNLNIVLVLHQYCRLRKVSLNTTKGLQETGGLID